MTWQDEAILAPILRQLRRHPGIGQDLGAVSTVILNSILYRLHDSLDSAQDPELTYRLGTQVERYRLSGYRSGITAAAAEIHSTAHACRELGLQLAIPEQARTLALPLAG